MLKTIDLFAGAGGLSLGFQLTGKFELLAAAEINKNAKETYKVNIAEGKDDFVFIDNVIGYDFAALNEKLGGIDVVIGGPPCQGFSNANRQKNHLISMNNSLVKEYFRAIKEIRPKAFVMENVSMLRSETHRFYESAKDNEIITDLINKGFCIPKRKEEILLTTGNYEGIELSMIAEMTIERYALPDDLFQLLNVLYKNLDNEKRLSNYLKKHQSQIIQIIKHYIMSQSEPVEIATLAVTNRLNRVKENMLKNTVKDATSEIEYLVYFQKFINAVREIKSNDLIGEYSVNAGGKLIFTTHSYSVIDYINAILGGEYSQVGSTINAKWFGVPQERKRYIVIGIRKDCYPSVKPELPIEPDEYSIPSVGDAILDLQGYSVGYDRQYDEIPYSEQDNPSKYAVMMRNGSTTVKNHIATKTTPEAMKRFMAIDQGKNFHSLPSEMKESYSKPERTQNTIYLRLNSEVPSGTVVNVRKSMWIHPTLNRAITVREAARLQSFPDSFKFAGTKDSQYQQVGNAVPPLLAKGIATQLLKYIK